MPTIAILRRAFLSRRKYYSVLLNNFGLVYCRFYASKSFISILTYVPSTPANLVEKCSYNFYFPVRFEHVFLPPNLVKNSIATLRRGASRFTRPRAFPFPEWLIFQDGGYLPCPDTRIWNKYLIQYNNTMIVGKWTRLGGPRGTNFDSACTKAKHSNYRVDTYTEK